MNFIGRCCFEYFVEFRVNVSAYVWVILLIFFDKKTFSSGTHNVADKSWQCRTVHNPKRLNSPRKRESNLNSTYFRSVYSVFFFERALGSPGNVRNENLQSHHESSVPPLAEIPFKIPKLLLLGLHRLKRMFM